MTKLFISVAFAISTFAFSQTTSNTETSFQPMAGGAWWCVIMPQWCPRIDEV